MLSGVYRADGHVTVGTSKNHGMRGFVSACPKMNVRQYVTRRTGGSAVTFASRVTQAMR